MDISQIANLLREAGLTMSTVESCTGGMISAICTDQAGSSDWFEGGVVTYSNEMKVALGVNKADIESQGAVSETVAMQMAENGREFTGADWCIAVTGIAGPGGGSLEKPVGTVWFAWASAKGAQAEKKLFEGDRASVRTQTRDHALHVLESLLR